MQETRVRFPGQENPLQKEMAIHSRILAEESHGQWSPVGYSPCGHKESNMTEGLNNSNSIKCRQLFYAWRYNRVQDKVLVFAGLMFYLEPSPKPVFSNMWILLAVLQVKSSGTNYIWKTLSYGIGNAKLIWQAIRLHSNREVPSVSFAFTPSHFSPLHVAKIVV